MRKVFKPWVEKTVSVIGITTFMIAASVDDIYNFAGFSNIVGLLAISVGCALLNMEHGRETK